MIKLMPAETSAKLTLRKRNKKFNQTKKDAIKDIKSAIKKGKYSTIIWIPDDWNDEDFLLFSDIRVEDRVHVNVHEVLEIRVVAACDRINGLIRVSHRI